MPNLRELLAEFVRVGKLVAGVLGALIALLLAGKVFAAFMGQPPAPPVERAASAPLPSSWSPQATGSSPVPFFGAMRAIAPVPVPEWLRRAAAYRSAPSEAWEAPRDSTGPQPSLPLILGIADAEALKDAFQRRLAETPLEARAADALRAGVAAADVEREALRRESSVALGSRVVGGRTAEVLRLLGGPLADAARGGERKRRRAELETAFEFLWR